MSIVTTLPTPKYHSLTGLWAIPIQEVFEDHPDLLLIGERLGVTRHNTKVLIVDVADFLLSAVPDTKQPTLSDPIPEPVHELFKHVQQSASPEKAYDPEKLERYWDYYQDGVVHVAVQLARRAPSKCRELSYAMTYKGKILYLKTRHERTGPL